MPTATLTTLRERVEAPVMRVNSETGVIFGVKILGRESSNGRVYSERAIKSAARLYEGIGVNINHTERNNPDRDRRLDEMFGVIKNTRIKQSDGAVYGDLFYLKSHPLAPAIVEAAQRMPNHFGLSHHAEGRVVRENGQAIVEDIDRVFSVDVVRQPATNRGLFESAGRRLRENGDCHDDVFPGADLTPDEIDEAILEVAHDGLLSIGAKVQKIEELLRKLPADSHASDADAPEPAQTPESFAATLKGKRIVEANSPARAAFVKSITKPERFAPGRQANTGTTGRKLRESSHGSRSAPLPKPAADASEFARAVKR